MKSFNLAEFYENLRKHFSASNSSEIRQFLEDSFRKVEAIFDDEAFVAVGNEFASYLRLIGDTSLSYHIYEKVEEKILQLVGDKSVQYASFLLNLGDVDMVAKNYKTALERFNKAEGILEDFPNESYLFASLYNNRSSAYRSLLMVEEAKKDIFKALQLVKDKDKNKGISLINLAEIYILDGDFYKAENTIIEALRIFKDAGLKDDIHYANLLSTAGQLYYYLGDYEKSYAYYSCSLRQFEAKAGKSSVYEIIKNNCLKTKSLLEKRDVI